MADVFISYSRQDRGPRLLQLVSKIRHAGFKIWMDDEIPAGRSYPAVIAEQLEQAWAVIVFWTKSSVDSDWVYEEAERGKKISPNKVRGMRSTSGFWFDSKHRPYWLASREGGQA